MKKLLAVVLASVLALSALAGCGGTAQEAAPAADAAKEEAAPAADAAKEEAAPAASGEEVTITFGTFETDNYTAEMWEEIFTAFEAANPGIKVEKVLATGDDRDTFWKTMIASGSLSDVVFGVSTLPQLGVCAEIPEDLQTLFDDAMMPVFNGQKTSFPVAAAESMQCYYHKDTFDKYGLKEPETYEDFLAICETLKAAGEVPMMTGGAGDVWATGEPWYSSVINPEIEKVYPDFNIKLRNGEVKYDNPELNQLLTDWQELVNKGYYYEGVMSLDYSQALAEFKNGSAVMFIDGCWGGPSYDGEGITEVGVFRMPTPSGLNNRLPDTNCFYVNKDSKNLDAAWKFCEFFVTNEDTYRMFLKADGNSSTTKKQVTYDMGPVTQKYYENIKDSTAITQHVVAKGDAALPSGMEDFMDKSFQNIFMGADVKTELQAWDEEYQAELENE